jgi:predicted Zn-dependent protease
MITNIALAASHSRTTTAVRPLAVAALGAGAAFGILLPMSRTQESEADHIGLILMAMAGYDPHAAIGVWERMRAAHSNSSHAVWLNTHPSDEQRINDIKAWVPEAMKYYRPQ